MIMTSLHRKVLLTYLSKAFETKPLLTNVLAHKLIYLIQNIPGAPVFCEFFYFKSEGPVSVTVDISLIEAESSGCISYYTKEGQVIKAPGIDDAYLFIKPGPYYLKIYKKNHSFFREMQPYVEKVVALNCSQEEYQALASVAYINTHINEFAEEVEDRADFITMILQEYKQYPRTEVARLMSLAHTYGLFVLEELNKGP